MTHTTIIISADNSIRRRLKFGASTYRYWQSFWALKEAGNSFNKLFWKLIETKFCGKLAARLAMEAVRLRFSSMILVKLVWMLRKLSSKATFATTLLLSPTRLVPPRITLFQKVESTRSA
jgi:hypothetical protein